MSEASRSTLYGVIGLEASLVFVLLAYQFGYISGFVLMDAFKELPGSDLHPDLAFRFGC